MVPAITRLRLILIFFTAAVILWPARAHSGPQNTRVPKQRPPKPGPIRPFRLPPIREVKLQNGLTLVLVEDHRAPMVTINIAIPVGDANDPAGAPGLAEATADLLTEGAGSRTSKQLAREVETLGAQMNSASTDDYTHVSVSVVAANADRLLEIARDVLLRPTFPEEEVALYKTNRIENLKVQRQDPSFLVSEHFNRIVYGPHPYSISAPTPESVAAIDRARVESFYRSNYTPAGSVAVVVGDFKVAQAESKLRALFGGWTPLTPREQKFPPMPERTACRVYLIDRPGSEQADVRIGNLAVAHSDSDYYALLVANAILGAGTSSRLFLNIRERKGYAYDVSSSLHVPRQRGTFFGATETRNEVTVRAIREVLSEFERMRKETVSRRDLRNAKNYLNGVFSLALSTQGGVAEQIVQAHMEGLESNYLEKYRSRIEAVTAQQVQQASRKYILSDREAIIVVGDAGKLRSDLELLAPVEVYDLTGKHGN